ncbi:MAG: ChbG/HpnK family deacetylase [Gammaproteobacteria bacterium]|nr:ChbG/HpnK family deacetylase [Gammaproteobacteria bacterium]NIR81729.1 ChbG/HpnK family deacetylase [Gammaproteobacteria bacterium]NIR88532.1 ChbG/HpnK family deacetylase [Gammaproteobacteria bacterium]NIU02836.1 ChbG/HpnK family deacetylase [Gammaproteobacteria bacterium]NIV50358.1 ChbG/HpnK family deacetylase [Gammaproteobacteria bacterium]
MRRLLIIADDFGLTPGVTVGIVAAMREGLVSGASAMVCVPGAEDNLRQWSGAAAGCLGLHLQLSGGRPACDPARVATLVDREGRFPRKGHGLGSLALPADQIEREWRAQAARLRALGIEPSHMDTHHHVHRHGSVFPVFRRLAAEWGLPARAIGPAMARSLQACGVPSAEHCAIEFYGEPITVERLVAVVEAGFAAVGGAGTLELMVHPGCADAALRARSAYVEERERERALLCSDRLAAALDAAGVSIIAPSELRKAP